MQSQQCILSSHNYLSRRALSRVKKIVSSCKCYKWGSIDDHPCRCSLSPRLFRHSKSSALCRYTFCSPQYADRCPCPLAPQHWEFAAEIRCRCWFLDSYKYPFRSLYSQEYSNLCIWHGEMEPTPKLLRSMGNIMTSKEQGAILAIL